jgi:hypothetical protein
VHGKVGALYQPAINITDALVPQADAEDGYLAAEIPDNIIGDAGFQGSTRPRGNDDMGRVKFFYLFQRNGVITVNNRFLSQFSQVLDEVIGKRIVIIYK